MVGPLRFVRHKFRFHPYYQASRFPNISTFERLLQSREKKKLVISQFYKNETDLKNVQKKQSLLRIDFKPSLTPKIQYLDQHDLFEYDPISTPSSQEADVQLPFGSFIPNSDAIFSRLKTMNLMQNHTNRNEKKEVFLENKTGISSQSPASKFQTLSLVSPSSPSHSSSLTNHPLPLSLPMSSQFTNKNQNSQNNEEKIFENDSMYFPNLETFLTSRTIPLAPHQIRPLRFFYNSFIAQKQDAVLLISPMGSGKTRMCIEFANWLQLNCLFVTTKIIVSHITKEIKKWLDPQLLADVQNGSFFDITTVEVLKCKLIIIDECHILANKKTKKLVKELMKLQGKVYIICLSGTPGDIEDQCNVLRPFEKNVSPDHSVLEIFWEPEYKPKNEMISLTLKKDQYEAFHKRREAVLSLQVSEQDEPFTLIRKKLSEWKLPFIIDLCKKAQKKGPKFSVLIVSEFQDILGFLDLRLDTSCKRKKLTSETKNITTVLQQFEEKQFQFLLALAGIVSHGIDLDFVHQLIFIEPQLLCSDQKQTNGRLPRLGKPNPDQTIISPFFKDTPDDELYKSHAEQDILIPALE